MDITRIEDKYYIDKIRHFLTPAKCNKDITNLRNKMTFK